MWSSCKKHTWTLTKDPAQFVCADCGAIGYQQTSKNPHWHRFHTPKILAYKCPDCGEGTLAKKAPCPNCKEKRQEARKLRNKEARSKDKVLTESQVKVLMRLDDAADPIPIRAGGTAISSLKKRGLVEYRSQTVYWITEKGRELLMESQYGEEN